MRWKPGLGSIRTRLVALLIVAAVPLIGMVSFVICQNYLATENEPLQRVELVLRAAAARHQASVEDTELLLAAISDVTLLQNATWRETEVTKCDEYLRRIVDRQPEKFTNIAILDATGHLQCSAVPEAASGNLQRYGLFADRDWFRSAEKNRQFTIMSPGYSVRSGVARTVAVQPIIAASGQFEGVVYGGLRLDWLLARAQDTARANPHYHLWLIDDAGRPIEMAQSSEKALPRTADLRAFLVQLVKPGMASATDGREYCYAVRQIGAGLRLMVGYDATVDLRLARRRVLDRAGEFAALLLLAVGAMAVGANYAVRVPLARLTEAVRRWRGGGPFETLATKLPAELRELSTAFSQATAALAAHEMQLRGALMQQDVLMQEIHHRVKNNMQIVASLLNLQAARIRQPEAKAEFQSARDRVRALATLHRHLYTHGEMHTINMRSFLNELCAQLFQALGETIGQRIRLEIEAPELRINSDQAVPLALIVTEIVSNSIKYAFPASRNGTIRVELTESAGRARLVIEDDGIGLAGPDDAADGGIGLQLVRGFCRQIGAALTMVTQSGMSYVIDIPLQQTRSYMPIMSNPPLSPVV
jgi:two-component sensor histidine kinase